MDDITIRPIGRIRSERTSTEDDFWGGLRATIELEDWLPDDALLGIADFSHVEILFVFDRVPETKIVCGARHPRNNPAWPLVGIFAQRGKNRPNRLGLATAKVVSATARSLVVEGLDAVDQTPVVDIKPVLSEFEPRAPIVQPEWATELMADYWSVAVPHEALDDDARQERPGG